MTTTYAQMMGRSEDSEKSLHFLGAHALMQLKGNLLQCDVRQRFFNPDETGNVEITYTCPLPFGAVLLGVEVTLNDKTLKGDVKARKEAREQYETSIAKGDSAFLVAVNPDGSVSMELGNLLAGESCEILLSYAQVLQVTQGSLRVMLPTTIAPRFGDAVQDGGFEPHSAPYASQSAQYPFSVEVKIEGALAGARIGSPSHSLAMQVHDGVAVFTLASQAWLDRDLILVLEDLPTNGLAVVSRDALEPEESVVLACLTPQIDSTTTTQTRAVTVQLLVDCSGSMGGERIASARAALLQITAQLTPEDQFSLNRFGTRSEHCHRRVVPVTSAQQALARKWIGELDANMGGTNMEDAIVKTLKIAGILLCDFLLVTDGDIHAVDSLIKTLRSQSHRCFVVGIGSSPSEAHLRRLAEATGGACEFVVSGEAVQSAIERMFARLRGARISQLSLRLPPGVQLMAIESLPHHAFMGDQVQSFIRIAGAWPRGAEVQLHGCLDGGADLQQEKSGAAEWLASVVPTPITEDADNTLARMAAHAVCRQWQRDQQGMASAAVNEAAKTRMTELAVRYQLITENTHFVLSHEREQGSVAMESPRLVTTPNMLVAGYGDMASFSAPMMLRRVRDDASPRSASAPSHKSHSISALLGNTNLYSIPRLNWVAPKTPQAMAQELLRHSDLTQLTRLKQLTALGMPELFATRFSDVPDQAATVQAIIRWLLLCEKAQWVDDGTWFAQLQQLGLDSWMGDITARAWPIDPVDEIEIPAFLRKQ